MSVGLSFQRRGLPADIRSRGAPQGYGVTQVTETFPDALTQICNDSSILRLLPRNRLDHRRGRPAGKVAPQIIFRLISVDDRTYAAATTYMALPEVEHVPGTRPTIDMASFVAPIDAIAHSAKLSGAIDDYAIAFDQALQEVLDSKRPLSKERLKQLPDLQIKCDSVRDSQQLSELALSWILTNALKRRGAGANMMARDTAPRLTFLAATLQLFLGSYATIARANDERHTTHSVAAYGDWAESDLFSVQFTPPFHMAAKISSESPNFLRSLMRRRQKAGTAIAFAPELALSPALNAFHLLSKLPSSEPRDLESLRRGLTEGGATDARRPSFAAAVLTTISTTQDRRPMPEPDERSSGSHMSGTPDGDERIAHASVVALLRALLLRFDSEDDLVINAMLDRVDLMVAVLAHLEDGYGWERPA